MLLFKIRLEHGHPRWFRRNEVFWETITGNRVIHCTVTGTGVVLKNGNGTIPSLKENIQNKSIRRLSKEELKMIPSGRIQHINTFTLTYNDMKITVPNKKEDVRILRNIPADIIASVITQSYNKQKAKKKQNAYGFSFYEHIRFDHYAGISTRGLVRAMEDLRDAWEQHPSSVVYQNTPIDSFVVYHPEKELEFPLTRKNILDHIACGSKENYRAYKDLLCWYAWMGRALAQYTGEIKIITEQASL